jgi:hypothetical protein
MISLSTRFFGQPSVWRYTRVAMEGPI